MAARAARVKGGAREPGGRRCGPRDEVPEVPPVSGLGAPRTLGGGRPRFARMPQSRGLGADLATTGSARGSRLPAKRGADVLCHVASSPSCHRGSQAVVSAALAVGAGTQLAPRVADDLGPPFLKRAPL